MAWKSKNAAALVPAQSEYAFAQDVTIKDSTGFLLASDRLEGRFIRHFCACYGAINFALDRLVREPAERLSGGAVEEDFSRDYYNQLSQMVFNARSRLDVMREGEAMAEKR